MKRLNGLGRHEVRNGFSAVITVVIIIYYLLLQTRPVLIIYYSVFRFESNINVNIKLMLNEDPPSAQVQRSIRISNFLFPPSIIMFIMLSDRVLIIDITRYSILCIRY